MRPGIESLLEALGGRSPDEETGRLAGLLRSGARCGLVANPASVTRGMESARTALDRAGVRIAALFGPEHGAHGAAGAGVEVDSSREPGTEIPVYSLYGPTLRPSRSMLDGLDVMLFDLQDVGVRFYTFTWTLSYMLEACAEAGIPLGVLDRPNPLGGDVAEGPLLDSALASFVGRFDIPLRHSFTTGELARIFAARYVAGAEVLVVRVQGWHRALFWENTGPEWAPPSPNIPTARTCWIYPATCLLEGTNLSEGRGTPLPFTSFGAPWIEPDRLAARLRETTGCRWRSFFFTPSSSKHRGTLCGGVEWHPPDSPEWRSSFRSVPLGLQILRAVMDLWPGSFQWLVNSDGISHFDRLIGRTDVRQRLDDGDPAESIVASWSGEPERFKAEAQDHHLYPGH